MKTLLMLLLLTCSAGVLAQEDTDPMPTEVAPEENFFPEESYESEMFMQKQEDFVAPSFPVNESSEDFMAEEEVYDSESEY